MAVRGGTKALKEYLREYDINLCRAVTECYDKHALKEKVNQTARIATGGGYFGKHAPSLVKRLLEVSEDPLAIQENLIFVVDSIMRHAARISIDTSKRFEHAFAPALKRLFKGALRRQDTREAVSTYLEVKLLPTWQSQGWFKSELPRIRRWLGAVALRKVEREPFADLELPEEGFYAPPVQEVPSVDPFAELALSTEIGTEDYMSELDEGLLPLVPPMPVSAPAVQQPRSPFVPMEVREPVAPFTEQGISTVVGTEDYVSDVEVPVGPVVTPTPVAVQPRTPLLPAPEVPELLPGPASPTELPVPTESPIAETPAAVLPTQPAPALPQPMQQAQTSVAPFTEQAVSTVVGTEDYVSDVEVPLGPVFTPTGMPPQPQSPLLPAPEALRAPVSPTELPVPTESPIEETPAGVPLLPGAVPSLVREPIAPFTEQPLSTVIGTEDYVSDVDVPMAPVPLAPVATLTAPQSHAPLVPAPEASEARRRGAPTSPTEMPVPTESPVEAERAPIPPFFPSRVPMPPAAAVATEQEVAASHMRHSEQQLPSVPVSDMPVPTEFGEPTSPAIFSPGSLPPPLAIQRRRPTTVVATGTQEEITAPVMQPSVRGAAPSSPTEMPVPTQSAAPTSPRGLFSPGSLPIAGRGAQRAARPIPTAVATEQELTAPVQLPLQSAAAPPSPTELPVPTESGAPTSPAGFSPASLPPALRISRPMTGTARLATEREEVAAPQMHPLEQSIASLTEMPLPTDTEAPTMPSRVSPGSLPPFSATSRPQPFVPAMAMEQEVGSVPVRLPVQQPTAPASPGNIPSEMPVPTEPAGFPDEPRYQYASGPPVAVVQAPAQPTSPAELPVPTEFGAPTSPVMLSPGSLPALVSRQHRPITTFGTATEMEIVTPPRQRAGQAPRSPTEMPVPTESGAPTSPAGFSPASLPPALAVQRQPPATVPAPFGSGREDVAAAYGQPSGRVPSVPLSDMPVPTEFGAATSPAMYSPGSLPPPVAIQRHRPTTVIATATEQEITAPIMQPSGRGAAPSSPTEMPVPTQTAAPTSPRGLFSPGSLPFLARGAQRHELPIPTAVATEQDLTAPVQMPLQPATAPRSPTELPVPTESGAPTSPAGFSPASLPPALQIHRPMTATGRLATEHEEVAAPEMQPMEQSIASLGEMPLLTDTEAPTMPSRLSPGSLPPFSATSRRQPSFIPATAPEQEVGTVPVRLTEQLPSAPPSPGNIPSEMPVPTELAGFPDEPRHRYIAGPPVAVVQAPALPTSPAELPVPTEFGAPTSPVMLSPGSLPAPLASRQHRAIATATDQEIVTPPRQWAGQAVQVPRSPTEMPVPTESGAPTSPAGFSPASLPPAVAVHRHAPATVSAALGTERQDVAAPFMQPSGRVAAPGAAASPTEMPVPTETEAPTVPTGFSPSSLPPPTATQRHQPVAPASAAQQQAGAPQSPTELPVPTESGAPTSPAGFSPASLPPPLGIHRPMTVTARVATEREEVAAPQTQLIEQSLTDMPLPTDTEAPTLPSRLSPGSLPAFSASSRRQSLASGMVTEQEVGTVPVQLPEQQPTAPASPGNVPSEMPVPTEPVGLGDDLHYQYTTGPPVAVEQAPALPTSPAELPVPTEFGAPTSPVVFSPGSLPPPLATRPHRHITTVATATDQELPVPTEFGAPTSPVMLSPGSLPPPLATRPHRQITTVATASEQEIVAPPRQRAGQAVPALRSPTEMPVPTESGAPTSPAGFSPASLPPTVGVHRQLPATVSAALGTEREDVAAPSAQPPRQVAASPTEMPVPTESDAPTVPTGFSPSSLPPPIAIQRAQPAATAMAAEQLPSVPLSPADLPVPTETGAPTSPAMYSPGSLPPPAPPVTIQRHGPTTVVATEQEIAAPVMQPSVRAAAPSSPTDMPVPTQTEGPTSPREYLSPASLPFPTTAARRHGPATATAVATEQDLTAPVQMPLQPAAAPQSPTELPVPTESGAPTSPAGFSPASLPPALQTHRPMTATGRVVTEREEIAPPHMLLESLPTDPTLPSRLSPGSLPALTSIQRRQPFASAVATEQDMGAVPVHLPEQGAAPASPGMVPTEMPVPTEPAGYEDELPVGQPPAPPTSPAELPVPTEFGAPTSPVMFSPGSLPAPLGQHRHVTTVATATEQETVAAPMQRAGRVVPAPRSPTEMPVPTESGAPTSPAGFSPASLPPALPLHSQAPAAVSAALGTEREDVAPLRVQPAGQLPSVPLSPTNMPVPTEFGAPTSPAMFSPGSLPPPVAVEKHRTTTEVATATEQEITAPVVQPHVQGAVPSSPTEMPVPTQKTAAPTSPEEQLSPGSMGFPTTAAQRHGPATATAVATEQDMAAPVQMPLQPTAAPQSPTELPVPTESGAPTSPAGFSPASLPPALPGHRPVTVPGRVATEREEVAAPRTQQLGQALQAPRSPTEMPVPTESGAPTSPVGFSPASLPPAVAVHRPTTGTVPAALGTAREEMSGPALELPVQTAHAAPTSPVALPVPTETGAPTSPAAFSPGSLPLPPGFPKPGPATATAMMTEQEITAPPAQLTEQPPPAPSSPAQMPVPTEPATPTSPAGISPGSLPLPTALQGHPPASIRALPLEQDTGAPSVQLPVQPTAVGAPTSPVEMPVPTESGAPTSPAGISPRSLQPPTGAQLRAPVRAVAEQEAASPTEMPVPTETEAATVVTEASPSSLPLVTAQRHEVVPGPPTEQPPPSVPLSPVNMPVPTELGAPTSPAMYSPGSLPPPVAIERHGPTTVAAAVTEQEIAAPVMQPSMRQRAVPTSPTEMPVPTQTAAPTSPQELLSPGSLAFPTTAAQRHGPATATVVATEQELAAPVQMPQQPVAAPQSPTELPVPTESGAPTSPAGLSPASLSAAVRIHRPSTATARLATELEEVAAPQMQPQAVPPPKSPTEMPVPTESGAPTSPAGLSPASLPPTVVVRRYPPASAAVGTEREEIGVTPMLPEEPPPPPPKSPVEMLVPTDEGAPTSPLGYSPGSLPPPMPVQRRQREAVPALATERAPGAPTSPGEMPVPTETGAPTSPVPFSPGSMPPAMGVQQERQPTATAVATEQEITAPSMLQPQHQPPSAVHRSPTEMPVPTQSGAPTSPAAASPHSLPPLRRRPGQVPATIPTALPTDEEEIAGPALELPVQTAQVAPTSPAALPVPTESGAPTSPAAFSPGSLPLPAGYPRPGPATATAVVTEQEITAPPVQLTEQPPPAPTSPAHMPVPTEPGAPTSPAGISPGSLPPPSALQGQRPSALRAPATEQETGAPSVQLPVQPTAIGAPTSPAEMPVPTETGAPTSPAVISPRSLQPPAGVRAQEPVAVVADQDAGSRAPQEGDRQFPRTPTYLPGTPPIALEVGPQAPASPSEIPVPTETGAPTSPSLSHRPPRVQDDDVGVPTELGDDLEVTPITPSQILAAPKRRRISAPSQEAPPLAPTSPAEMPVPTETGAPTSPVPFSPASVPPAMGVQQEGQPTVTAVGAEQEITAPSVMPEQQPPTAAHRSPTEMPVPTETGAPTSPATFSPHSLPPLRRRPGQPPVTTPTAVATEQERTVTQQQQVPFPTEAGAPTSPALIPSGLLPPHTQDGGRGPATAVATDQEILGPALDLPVQTAQAAPTSPVALPVPTETGAPTSPAAFSPGSLPLPAGFPTLGPSTGTAVATEQEITAPPVQRTEQPPPAPTSPAHMPVPTEPGAPTSPAAISPGSLPLPTALQGHPPAPVRAPATEQETGAPSVQLPAQPTAIGAPTSPAEMPVPTESGAPTSPAGYSPGSLQPPPGAQVSAPAAVVAAQDASHRAQHEDRQFPRTPTYVPGSPTIALDGGAEAPGSPSEIPVPTEMGAPTSPSVSHRSPRVQDDDVGVPTELGDDLEASSPEQVVPMSPAVTPTPTYTPTVVAEAIFPTVKRRRTGPRAGEVTPTTPTQILAPQKRRRISVPSQEVSFSAYLEEGQLDVPLPPTPTNSPGSPTTVAEAEPATPTLDPDDIDLYGLDDIEVPVAGMSPVLEGLGQIGPAFIEASGGVAPRTGMLSPTSVPGIGTPASGIQPLTPFSMLPGPTPCGQPGTRGHTAGVTPVAARAPGTESPTPTYEPDDEDLYGGDDDVIEVPEFGRFLAMQTSSVAGTPPPATSAAGTPAAQTPGVGGMPASGTPPGPPPPILMARRLRDAPQRRGAGSSTPPGPVPQTPPPQAARTSQSARPPPR